MITKRYGKLTFCHPCQVTKNQGHQRSEQQKCFSSYGMFGSLEFSNKFCAQSLSRKFFLLTLTIDQSIIHQNNIQILWQPYLSAGAVVKFFNHHGIIVGANQCVCCCTAKKANVVLKKDKVFLCPIVSSSRGQCSSLCPS